jgi:flagellar motor switch protein FliG
MGVTVSSKYASITGAQKAAILILAIGEAHGGKVFAMLHEDEIREVSKAMVQLGPIPADIVEQLCAEFSNSVGSATGLSGGIESTERLLLRSLPADRVAQIMEEIHGPAGRTMWDKLGNVDESVLASYLKHEYPQTVAVVISKIKPERAAMVLAELPEAFSTEVVMRLLRMEAVQKDVLDGVEKTLRSEFMSNLARTAKRDPHEQMATIFNSLDRKTELRFLTALERRDQEAADRIRALMFTFEDLGRIPVQGIQVLLRSVQKNRIALALKGAPAELKELFFRNLSERAGKMLREEIEGLGPVKLKDVDEARAELVRVAKELGAQGKIEIKAASEEEVVY